MGGDVIINVTDNKDGTAEVCRNMIVRHRFQRSFDYVFDNTSGNDPTSATTFDLPVIQENTSSFEVKINQADPEIFHTVVVNCTRGVVCETEAFIGGLLIETQYLGALNLTIRELNQIEINDPALFDSLIAEHFYIIKKTTSSGATIVGNL